MLQFCDILNKDSWCGSDFLLVYSSDSARIVDFLLGPAQASVLRD